MPTGTCSGRGNAGPSPCRCSPRGPSLPRRRSSGHVASKGYSRSSSAPPRAATSGRPRSWSTAPGDADRRFPGETPRRITSMAKKVRLLNVDVDDITLDELVDSFQEGLLLTLHVDMIMKLQKDREFYELLPNFSPITCDSQILVAAA